MEKELEQKLQEKYPNLYKYLGGNPRETCMAWGIAVGAGWYDIIDELSAVLEKHGAVAAQVKEKFGGLRFYLEPFDGTKEDYEIVQEAIEEAERKAYQTCESCGKPGTPRGGWITILCDDCHVKRESRKMSKR